VSERQVKTSDRHTTQHTKTSPGSGMKARHCRNATPPLQLPSPTMPRGNALSKQHKRAAWSIAAPEIVVRMVRNKLLLPLVSENDCEYWSVGNTVARVMGRLLLYIWVKERSPEEPGIISWFGKRLVKREVKTSDTHTTQHTKTSPGSGMKVRHCRNATLPLQLASPTMPRGNALSKQRKEQHDLPRSAEIIVRMVRIMQLSLATEKQPRILERREYPLRAQWVG
jgi:hypothetical protein